MTRITFVGQCHTELEIIEESSFINIKHVFRLVSVNYFGQFFAFPVHQCFGIYKGTFSWHSLVYQVCVFLKWSIQLSEARIDEQLHVEPLISDGVHQWKHWQHRLTWTMLNGWFPVLPMGSLENDGPQNASFLSISGRLLIIVCNIDTDKPSTAAGSTWVPMWASTLANICIFLSTEKTLHCFFILFSFEDIFIINGKFLASLATTVEHQTIPHFVVPTRVQTRIVWLGLACLIPKLVLLAEFILATEAAHVLLANFAGPIITLVSQKLHEWKCL